MRILVTGAAGFLGSHTVEALLARGHEVVGVDDFNDFYDPAVKRRNLASVRGPFTWMECDIRDGRMEEVIRGGGFDAVVHLAARAGVRPSVADPALYFDVNVEGTRRIAEAMRRHGPARLVFASSSSVYGNAPTPFDEERTLPAPISPYGASKLAAEALLRSYAACFGLRVSCLRFFTAYGPRQRPDMAIHSFARRILAGEDVPVYGPGDSRRDYTYVSDVVDAVVRCVERDEAWGVYNIGGAHTVPLMEMIETLARALGRPAKVRHEPPHPADPPATHACVERARRVLGWAPTVPFEDGVRRFAEWIRSGP